tara:strand:+ start:45 stop:1532 length:1488 start_codon:yes stop_codon:yes gene_type:complete
MTHQVGHMPNENASMKELVEYQKNLKSFIDKNQGLSVSSDDTDSFIKKQNEIGVSGGISQLNSNLGALAPFINQASGILDNIYGKTVEPTQKDKDINMGRIALKFFTQLGAASSVPGQTALGAANIAGASVAQDYLNKVQSDKDKSDKLEQAKKAGSISLGMQLKSAKEAKELAKLKIKPDYINIYKTDKNGLGEKVLNVIKGSADYIKKTSPGGGYITDKPPAEKAPTVYEDSFGEKRFLTGPNEGQLVSDVMNAKKVENNEEIDGEIINEDDTVSTDKPKLKRLTKIEMGYVKQYRSEIEKLTKDFRDIQGGYQKIVGFYNTKGSIGDYGLAVQFAKLIDPGSVAREGEVSAVQRSGSLSDRVKADIINVINGMGNLPPRTRAGIYNRAIEIFNVERVKAVDIINKFKGFLSADLRDDKQGGRLDFFTVGQEVPLSELVDLTKLKEIDRDFVYNEEKIKKMSVKELTDIVSFQNLSTEQLQFIKKLVKKKKAD